MTEVIGTARLDIVVNTEDLEPAIERAKRGVTGMSQAAQAEYQKLSGAERRRADALIRQADTLGLTRAQQVAYNATLRTSGALHDELIGRIRASEAATRAGANAMNQYGQSAKQAQAALRGVPAQLTDIITSLQGGQNPLTVLLQQGGQLRDMFGGVAPAARALGGALLGLVNPYTLVAGAAAALAIAWHKGSEEATRYNEALILTGNYAGKTADQLAVLASQLDTLDGVTTGSAAAAIAAVAGTGRFTGEQLELVATAAEQMRAATGKAIEETIEEFEGLRKDPVKAILELNDKYHFLTQTQLDRIETLKEEGREQEAVAEAMRTYAGVIGERTPQIVENLGYIEKAWRGIKNLTREAVDGLLSVGRAAPVQQQIADLTRANSVAFNELQRFDPSSDMAAFIKKGISERYDEIKRLNKQLAEDAAKAKPQATVDSATERARMEAEKDFDRTALSNLDKKAKLEREIADLKEKGAKAGKSSAEIDKAVNDARARFAEAEARSQRKGSKIDPTAALLKRVQDQTALNAQQARSTETLTASERIRIQVLEELERIGGKVSAGRRAEIDAALEQLRVSGELAEAHKKEVLAKRELAKLQDEITAREGIQREQNNLDLARFGMGNDAADQALRRLDIERQYAKEVEDLHKRAASQQREVLAEEEQALRESRDRMILEEERYQRERAAAMGDWRNGATAAVQDFVADSADIAGQMYDIWSGAFDGLSDVLTDVITKGKGDFAGFLNSLAADITAFLVKQQLSKWLGQLFGGGRQSGGEFNGETMGTIFDLWSSSGWGFASGGYTGAGGKYEPAGVVHRGEYVINADATRMIGRSFLDRLNAGRVPVTSGGGGPVTQIFNTSIQGRMDRTTEEQFHRRQGREAARGMARTGR
ncbi:phage tail tape measure protein [Lysobacter soli]|uniref:phage tail tape measure protein n=1 Tax=Lysobacter soli TaxID=453783 RepID=UPI0037CB4FC1